MKLLRVYVEDWKKIKTMGCTIEHVLLHRQVIQRKLLQIFSFGDLKIKKLDYKKIESLTRERRVAREKQRQV